MRKVVLSSLLFLLAPMVSSANPGSYGRLELGLTTLSQGTSHMFDPVGNPSGTSGRISGGYLWGNNATNYGLEMGFGYFPHATFELSLFGTQSVSYKGYTTDVLGVLQHVFQNSVTLFGKAGAAYVHQQATTSYQFLSYQTSYDKSGNKIAPEVAIGVGYQFTPQVEIDLTSSMIFAGSPSQNNPVASSQNLLLGLTYYFG